MKLFREHEKFWTETNMRSLWIGLLLLFCALLIQIGAGRYSERNAANAPFAGDIFLDNIPVIHTDAFIVQGAVVLWIGTGVLLAFRPRYLLFGLKAVALFVIVRAFFITLTHIGIYPREVFFNADGLGSGIYKLVTFQGNYFFSGHTGLPFLMGLIFFPERWWRRSFFILSFIFGTSVLLAHVHYSIDVFAAPFIAYSIFVLTTKLFPRDYELSVSSPSILRGSH